MPQGNGSQPMAAGIRNAVGCSLLVGCGSAALGATGARADGPPEHLELRTSAGAALMVSHDQRGYLDYRAPGVLSDIELGYWLAPWLSLQLGAAGGLFLSSAPGGLLAPMLGGLLELSGHAIAPYVGIDLGAGFTGSLLRPFARALCGFEFPLSGGFRIGPRLGLDFVLQRGGAGYSTDAISSWLGVSVAFSPPSAAGPPGALALASPPPTAARTAPLPPPIAELPPAEHPPAAPSPELSQLLDQAVAVEHSELFAPLLFGFDSCEPEPSGIAMLHEVARLLNGERRDITRLQIAA